MSIHFLHQANCLAESILGVWKCTQAGTPVAGRWKGGASSIAPIPTRVNIRKIVAEAIYTETPWHLRTISKNIQKFSDQKKR